MNATKTPSSQNRLPGPVIPAWTQTITNLLPWRVDFDSLGYMRQQARKFGHFYAMWMGDQPIYVISDPKLAREILVERPDEFHKAALVKDALAPIVGNGLFANEGDFYRSLPPCRASHQ